MERSSATIGFVELLPRVLIVGLFAPPSGIPGAPEITMDTLNRIWSELSNVHGYTQFQVAQDKSAAKIVGTSEEVDGVTIQLPLLQVRDPIYLTPEKSAEKAEMILKTIARHLGTNQFFNLGIRHVFHAPIPDKDARAFVLHRLLGKDENELGQLQAGGALWAGVKYVTSFPGTLFTLKIEPLQADNQHLFIDLDAQFTGGVQLDMVKAKAKEAESYVGQAVNAYLDRFMELGG